MIKLKSSQTRTYDRDGYKQRAACLCFRSEREEEVTAVSRCCKMLQDVIYVLNSVFHTLVLFPQAGVKGTLGRLVGVFENKDRKHRTYVYVLIVTEVLEDWEDSVNIGRKREWFKTEDARRVLQCHKPVQASYFEALQQDCMTSNGTPLVATYNINQNSLSSIR
uniref:Nudix (nucleoside diphosphate linked moiety X)-type motif 3a n=1 Tax=Sinocyclocheilus grahami TaxID=75366 RepID=A0A672T2S0_SINGR